MCLVYCNQKKTKGGCIDGTNNKVIYMEVRAWICDGG